MSRHEAVRTHQGKLAFRLDVEGLPQVERLLVGQMITETRLVEGTTHGGPGFPLPAAKAKRVAEARARKAAEGTPPEGGDPPPAEEGGGDDPGEDAGGGG